MIKPSDCTILIPHLGGSSEAEYALDQCLPSLKETFTGKIIVVKNGSNTDCKHSADIYVVSQGQCKAVNAAAATVNTPWIFVTNDDMIYGSNWFENLTFIEEDFQCISPQLVEPRSGAPSFLVEFCGGAGGDFDKSKWLDFYNKHESGIIRSGFNLPFLVKKEVFDLVGGYDIQYDPWGASSDTDIQCKFELAGVKTFQNTSCIVYHFSQTSGTFHPDNQSYWVKNYAYFQEKWGYERPGDPDVWFSRNLINYEKLKYNPWWKDFYKKKTPEDKAELS